MLSHIENGNARALAVTTAERSPIVPSVPSLEHAGYKGSASELWWDILAPVGTPNTVVERLNIGLRIIVTSPHMKEFFLKARAKPAPMMAGEFEEFNDAEISRRKGSRHHPYRHPPSRGSARQAHHRTQAGGAYLLMNVCLTANVLTSHSCDVPALSLQFLRRLCFSAWVFLRRMLEPLSHHSA